MLMCPMTLAAKQMSAARFGLWSGHHPVDRQYRHAAVGEPAGLVVELWGGARDSGSPRVSARWWRSRCSLLVPKQPAAQADQSSPLSQMAEVLRIGLSRPLRG
jgi:hypothetical protein